MNDWENAYDEFLKDVESRPSQTLGWFNHPLFPGQKLLVNLGRLFSSAMH